MYEVGIENIKDPVFIHFAEGKASETKFISVNDAACRLFGYSRNELGKLSPKDVISKNKHKKLEVLIDRVITNGHALYELIAKKKNGNAFNIEADARLINVEGKPAIMAIARELKFRLGSDENYMWLKNLVDTTEAGVIATDLKGNTLTWNKAAEKIFQIDSKDAIGKHIGELILSGREEFAQISAKIQTGNKISRFEKDYYPGKKKKLFVSLTISMITDIDGAFIGYSIIARDVTDRAIAVQELQKSREQLRKLAKHNEAVRENERKMIAIEVHDQVGQSLTALSLDLSWLLRKMPPEMQDFKGKLESMHEMIDMTSRQVSKITSMLRPTVLDHFGLIPAIEWQAEEFRKRSGIGYEIEVIPDEFQIDEKKSTVIFRIFQEMLTNIVRHAKATKIRIDILKNDETITMSVTDNGIGLIESRLDEPESFGIMGMRERAYSIGGNIEFESEKNKGTTARLVIPAEGVEQ